METYRTAIRYIIRIGNNRGILCHLYMTCIYFYVFITIAVYWLVLDNEIQFTYHVIHFLVFTTCEMVQGNSIDAKKKYRKYKCFGLHFYRFWLKIKTIYLIIFVQYVYIL